jgi:hypothetical protein
VRVTCDESRVDSRFLCAWINSPWGRQWARTVRTDCVSQSNINSSKLKRMPVPTPPLSEQREIMRRIEARFQGLGKVETSMATGTAMAEKLVQAVLDKAFRGELVPTEAELARLEGRTYEPGWVLLGRIRSELGRRPAGKRSGRISLLTQGARREGRSRTVAVYDPDQVLVAFRQACWGAGAMTEDELVRRVADRIGVARLGKNVRARLVAHLETAIARRVLARRGELLEGATPTFARYDDEFLLQVIRSVLKPGAEHDPALVVRSVASHLGYGQVTAAMRGRMEELFRAGARKGLFVLQENRIWRRG